MYEQTLMDDILHAGADVFVMPGKPDETTFVAANKRGRDAVRRAVEKMNRISIGSLHLAWRDAGGGWLDTWLGFDFMTPDHAPFAAAICEEGVNVFHINKNANLGEAVEANVLLTSDEALSGRN
jgi:hypothetical protein